jgi:hypothetical protein
LSKIPLPRRKSPEKELQRQPQFCPLGAFPSFGVYHAGLILENYADTESLLITVIGEIFIKTKQT